MKLITPIPFPNFIDKLIHLKPPLDSLLDLVIKGQGLSILGSIVHMYVRKPIF